MKDTLFNHSYRMIFIFLLGIYSYINILFTGGKRLFEVILPDWALLLGLVLNVFLIWEGNRFLFRLWSKQEFSLIHYFLMSLVLVLVLAVITPSIGIFSFEWPHNQFVHQGKLAFAFVFGINLFLHAINGVYFYSSKWWDAEIEAEKLRAKNAEYHYEALRNQIDPHFLFNSFSVLESIIFKDPDKASTFIRELSRVYRYFLYHQENKTVPLDVELEFINSYLYLYQIRFEDQILFDNCLSFDFEDYYVPPGSLQILIENCLKHNHFSKNDPIKISLYMEAKEYLIVKNNYNPKKITENSNKTGLKNLIQRYSYITDLPVIIPSDEKEFIVKIPLIKEWER